MSDKGELTVTRTCALDDDDDDDDEPGKAVGVKSTSTCVDPRDEDMLLNR